MNLLNSVHIDPMQRIVDEDFRAMKSMIEDIRKGIAHLPVSKQQQFYWSIKHIIAEAHADVNNPHDSFLKP